MPSRNPSAVRIGGGNVNPCGCRGSQRKNVCRSACALRLFGAARASRPNKESRALAGIESCDGGVPSPRCRIGVTSFGNRKRAFEGQVTVGKTEMVHEVDR